VTETGMTAGSNVLRRIARAPAPPPSLTPARAVRLAVTRAAERSIALSLAVLGVAEEEGTLDELLSRLELRAFNLARIQRH
jgi:hypothetical protein